jgi:hypothetical protein
VTNSTFSGNSAYPTGGAGGGIANWNMLTVSGSTFSGNIAWDGGGIRSYAGTLTVSGSTFSGNRAGQLGGGILNYPSSPGGMATASWLSAIAPSPTTVPTLAAELPITKRR